MLDVTLRVSMSVDGAPANAADVARWLGEALVNPDVRNSTDVIMIHSLSVDGDS